MKRKFSTLVLLFGIIYSCSKSDDVGPPQFAYAQPLEACFFQEGNSLAPSVDWNGDQGQFALQDLVESVTLDAQTGVISWDKTLAPGLSNFSVLASNQAGTRSTTVSIENILVGNFGGSYSLGGSSYDLDLNFTKDGTGTLVVHGPAFRQIEGSWTIEDGLFTGEFQDPEDSFTYFMDGELTITKTGAKIAGTFTASNGYVFIPGSFELFLVGVSPV